MQSVADPRFKPFLGLREPREIKGYPLKEETLIRRYKKHAVKRALLRQPRPRIHARGPSGVRTRLDTEALRHSRGANVQGSWEERIFYQALIDRGFIPEVDFTFQAAEFGGRAELGGLVADFMFPLPAVVVQVQSYWHRLTLQIERRDSDQAALLQASGYVVLEIWPNTINDPVALEDWLDRYVDHLWGTSSSPIVGGTRDGSFADVIYEDSRMLEELDIRLKSLEQEFAALNGDPRLDTLEQALFGNGAGGPAVRVSSAYIAQILSSSNFESGVAGWQITKDGSMEINDLLARGTVQSFNFVTGVSGWQINEDGSAEFLDITARGGMQSANYDPGVAGWKIFSTGRAEFLDIDARGTVQSFNYDPGVAGWIINEDGSAEFLDLTARGDMQSDNFQSGVRGWKIDGANDSAEFQDVVVRGSIRAAAFQYDAVSAVGGQLLVGPATTLGADIAVGATTLIVTDAQFVNNDFLFLKEGGVSEVMKVVSGGGTTTLTVTRAVSGTDTNWKKGTAVVRKGDRITLDTISAYGPFLDIIDYAGPLTTDESVRVRLGNLAGITDPDLNPTGFGLYSDNAYLSGKAVFGEGNVILDSTGMKLIQGSGLVNSLRWEETDTTLIGRLYAAGGSTYSAVFLLDVPAGSFSIQEVFARNTSSEQAGILNKVNLSTTPRILQSYQYAGAANSTGPTEEFYYEPVTGISSAKISWRIEGSLRLELKDGGLTVAGTSKAIKGVGSNFPNLGSTTAAEQWGNVYLGAAKAIIPASGAAYQYPLSTNRPGVTRLFRNDGDSNYNVQTFYTGTYWHLRGYQGDTFHAPCEVSHALNADSASTANLLGGYAYNTLPAPGAAVTYTAAQAIPHNTVVTLSFNTARNNTFGVWEGSNYLRAVWSGWYSISAHVQFQGSTGGTYRQVLVHLNDSVYIAATLNPPPGGVTPNLSLSAVYYMSAGHYIRLRVNHDAGVTLNINAVGNYSPEFRMVWMGA